MRSYCRADGCTQRIVEVASRLLGDPEAGSRMARPSTAFGDGHASVRILDALLGAERTREGGPPRLSQG